MQTCGAGSNWGSAGSSTGQVCILGKQASLVAACKRFIRPQVTCKLRKSTGGPCACDMPWWSVCMRLPLVPKPHKFRTSKRPAPAASVSFSSSCIEFRWVCVRPPPLSPASAFTIPDFTKLCASGREHGGQRKSLRSSLALRNIAWPVGQPGA
jgi:hypothetical protein